VKHLLDVNVLLAAIWTTHTHHERVQTWLKGKDVGLCPISELGFIRISTNKRAIDVPMERAWDLLSKFAKNTKAERIPADLDALNSQPRTSDQVTDHYLADLAAKHGLKLATLDGQLKHSAAELVR
jgi:toxin-antitoxin system PIN domain toxin